MHKNKLAVALKAHGKILREIQDSVYVPFGTEYSILIKNLNTVRANINITIDGTEVTEGVSLVVQPKSDFDLTRFIKNGNLDSGNKFKFIERTSKIEDHRGIGIEDGLIRVEFQFEKIFPPIGLPQYRDIHYHHWHHQPYYQPYFYGTSESMIDGNMQSINSAQSMGVSNDIQFTANSISDRNVLRSRTLSADAPQVKSIVSNDAGITVPGSVSDQQFHMVTNFPVESETHVIVLKLIGETHKGKVKEAVTVKSKAKCVTCGRVNKNTNKFCSECGTALEIIK